MGSPLSSVVANLFMEDFETKALEEWPLKPKLWLRYVDDILVIWQHGDQQLEDFLTFLNSRHPAIKFTCEKEEENKLPFLDLLIINEGRGRLGHTIYRKPTATGRHLHAQSHHHPAQKRGLIKTLTHRAMRLCSNTEYLKKELNSLRTELMANGYNKGLINRIFKEIGKKYENPQQPLEGPQIETPPEWRLTLPYVRGISEKLGRILQKKGIKCAFKPLDKTNQLLGSAKDPQRLQDSGVYLLPCDCGSVYIGQTGKKIQTRIGQHLADYKHDRVKTSAVAEHGNTCNKQILFDEVKTLSKENALDRRLVREAVEIVKHPNNFNREDGYKLPDLWKPALRKISKQKTREGRVENNTNRRPKIEKTMRSGETTRSGECHPPPPQAGIKEVTPHPSNHSRYPTRRKIEPG